MPRFVPVLLIVLAIPVLFLVPVQSTERQPTMLEVDLEYFQHVEYPCHAFKMIQISKNWKVAPREVHKLGRNALTAALLVTSEKSLTEGDQMTAARLKKEAGIDLRTMSREQRILVYHLSLSTCISAHYGWDADDLKDKPFLQALSATGWK